MAGLLGRTQPDPFASELVVVPAKGVERWLTQRLSHRLGAGPGGGDGVCAGVDLVSPRSLVATLTGTERSDPWVPERLVWPVLDAVDAALGEPWGATLAHHLGEDRTGAERELRRGRRWSVARRLAGLFAAYAVQRPALLRAWGEGRDEDGTGEPLEPDLGWQAPLWRAVTARVDAPAPHVRHARTLEAIAAGRPLALPTRLSLFGHTRLPVTEVELVRAVAAVREVHLWLPTPSTVLWESLAPLAAEGVVRRDADASARAVGHPLLSSLGRDTRELRRTLGGLGALGGRDEVVPDVLPPTPAPATLLGLLQHDLRHDHEPTGAERAARVVAASDRSVQVHAAHGSARQVEVLRDVLVGLLEDDPTLEPRDIVVLCPDIDVYAPLFHAAFGLGGVVGPGEGGHPAHRLRLRLADRGLAATNPFLALAADLLALASGRATLSEVLALAASDPVRHRFALGDDDLDTIATWAEEAGVRWGLSAPLRDAFGLAAVADNTWSAGLDRLLAGVAVAESGTLLGGVLPLDDVASAQVDLAGRVAELVDRVEAAVVGLRSADDLAGWVAVLRDAVHALGSTSPQDAWQVAQLERELVQVLDAGTGGVDGARGPRLTLPDLRALLEDRTAGRPTRASFRTGALTVCTMVPMRSVPHRVVALVGLDDGLFPRTSTVDGDDVLGRHPLTGERDARSEDRQLLLDAVLAATETLVVTYTGANEVSGQDRPPAVPLGELLDAVDGTATRPDGSSVRAQVVVRHPLQPYDARTVTPGVLFPGDDRPFTFDRAALAGAQAGAALEARLVGAPDAERSTRRRPAPLLTRPLPARPPTEVSLAALHDALIAPARAFLRRRLDVAVPRDEPAPSDAVPLELDSLQQWAIGDRMLSSLLDGVAPQDVVDAECHRGVLPPGDLSDALLTTVTRRAGLLVQRTDGLRTAPARSIDVDLELPVGRRLTGVVTGVRGDRLVRIHYSSLAAKHRLASWVDLLAVAAMHSGRPWIAATVGWRGGREQQPTARRLDVPDDPLGVLAELVDLHDRALREPLPLPVKTAAAWAEAAVLRRPAELLARREWETQADAPVPGEQDEAAHVLAFGAKRPFAELKNLGAGDAGRAGTDDPGGAETWNDEPCRLGRLAVRLWAPLLQQEKAVPL
ncbi:exodeoxyribonuclease V subunit gamma [Lapillicoccus jejuensis]|uniref:exodeoxyribonuclease V subunit gamma n=1 Tax=Lapillicoccus jejuensis TaxID=402171 RepID=UPI00319E0EB6